MLDEHAVDRHLVGLCKPPGSLGMIETIAKRLCMIQQTLSPITRPRHVSVFAADHGVTCEGVTAFPSEVTRAVVSVMQNGRTASGVFADSLECSYEVVDVGLLRPLRSAEGCLIDAASRRGTGNLRREPAMTPADFDYAWRVGEERAGIACDGGAMVLIGGEMGIGNTTAASCLIGLLCDVPAEHVVGRGAGIDDDTLRHKQTVVAQAMERVRDLGAGNAHEIACQVGGLEVISLAGFYSEAARRGRTILVDGLIATSAALLADAIHRGARNQMIASHRSAEPGHLSALEMLQLEPVLDLGMRLGEASGALACLPLLDLAAAMCSRMASLDELDTS
jgi:nicotinate-nucleotide--dimethylbenzimidazole phosphoribosyltransferase